LASLLGEQIMKLEQITLFNNALIYGFDPEVSQQQFDNLNTVEYLLHGARQHQDMFNAYFYAQEDILPAIKEIGIANITPEQLIKWFNQVHLFTAATLAKDNGVTAGEFTQRQVLRWHNGGQIGDILNRFLSGLLPSYVGLPQLTQQLVKEYDINADIASKFLQLLLKIQDNHGITIPEDQRPYIDSNSPSRKGTLTLHKLVALSHTNQLATEERAVVEKIVKICLPPAKYPQAMAEFANDLLAAWRNCDPTDIDQIARLVQTAFYGITEIHPYFNGNGRTATCFLNVILRSLERPSILMRYPSESEDANSSYSQAIKHINTRPELLVQHIKNRIQETEAKGDYTNQELAEIIMLRVKCSEVILAIKNKFPDYQINEFYQGLMTEVCKEASTDINSCQNEMIKYGLNRYIESFTKQFECLQKRASTIKPSVSSVVQRKYSVDEKAKIVTKLEALTGKTGWITYKKNGLTILLNLDDQETANQLVEALKTTNALQAKLMKNPQTQKHVVCLDSINPEKLAVVKSLIGIVKSEQTPGFTLNFTS
jgi:hypothetical protein